MITSWLSCLGLTAGRLAKFRGLPQLVGLLGEPDPWVRLTLTMDGDIISLTNCVRQPFSSSEVGLSKAVVMVSRLNLFWGLNWTAMPEFISAQSKIAISMLSSVVWIRGRHG